MNSVTARSRLITKCQRPAGTLTECDPAIFEIPVQGTCTKPDPPISSVPDVTIISPRLATVVLIGIKPNLAQRDRKEQRSCGLTRRLVTPPKAHSRSRE
jgi:hypothetical protein